MKKNMAIVFVLALALCSMAGAFAQSESDFTVSTKDGKVTITKYTGNGGAVVIPATIGGNPVVEIGSVAFSKNTGLTSVSIPTSVTSIGERAFYGCTGLTSVSIPASVTSIGEIAFYGCTGLTSVSISAGVAGIGDAFTGCTGLVSEQGDFELILVGGMAIIKSYTGKAVVVVIPAAIGGKPVVAIGDRAFYDRKDITSISIPEGVTGIGRLAFYSCSRLTSIRIPSSVTNIGERAFSGSITYGDNGTDRSSGIESITVDPRNTFYSSRDGVLFNKNATTLVCYPPARKERQYTIPEGVTRIEDNAFDNRRHLRALSIPASVTSIGDMEYGGIITTVHAVRPPKYEGSGNVCYNLHTVYVPAASLDAYRNADGWGDEVRPETALHARQTSAGFEISDGKLISYFGSSATAVIPSDWGITSIGGSAFYGCTALTSVSIPVGVTSIGSWAFYGCTGLTSVSIPASVTSIGDWAFMGCTALTSVSIPKSVTGIGSGAFSGCTRLTSINIPASVTSIESHVFSGCISLTAITVDANNKNYVSLDGVLFNKTGDTLIAYPAGLKGQYAIPAGVTSIEIWAFDGCTGLTSVSIPASVTSIGNRAFMGCTALTSVSIPKSVTGIGSGAFEGCTGLTSVSIPAGVTSIGQYAFSECTRLTSVSIPASVTSIKSNAFRGCTGLTSVSIPASVTSIDMSAFQGCTSLTSITIGTNVRLSTSSGGADAFENKFVTYYNTNGKKAGVYTFRGGAWSYAAR